MRIKVAVVAAITFAAGITLAGAPVQAAPAAGLTIWADQTRANVLTTQFPKGFGGKPLKIVVKDFAAIKSELPTVALADAPDVIAMEHEWVGGLVESELLAPTKLTADQKALFPANVLSGFSYAGKMYGVPVSFENVALITNVALVKTAPATFDALAKKALKLKKAGKITVPFAVGQGASGDAYRMYPLFAGLGGYVFGTDASGAVDVQNIGVDNGVFKTHQAKIDGWNKTTLIDSALTSDAAKNAFVTGDSPFWITGPWDAAALAGLKFKYRVSPLPNIVTGLEPSPLLGMKGFAVTAFASQHKRSPLAKEFLRTGLTALPVQTAFGSAAGRMPAATAGTPASTLIKAFGVAGSAGIPVPNVPQMSTVWAPLGKAWATSTSGAAAVPAKDAFAEAALTIQTDPGALRARFRP
ncbi:MAG: maltose-binding protein MalE [Actinomycetota bacterium]|jgi:arabinogalactan oligomer/maltooligosaccharide transport system substrate-binding protein